MKSKERYLEKLTHFLDKAFKVPRSYQLKHVIDNTDVVSKEESLKRIEIGLLVIGKFFSISRKKMN